MAPDQVPPNNFSNTLANCAIRQYARGMTTSIALSELASEHLGKTITISTVDGDVTGLLLGVTHEADLTDMYVYRDVKPVRRHLTDHNVRVTLRGWGERGFRPATEATIHEPEAAA